MSPSSVNGQPAGMDVDAGWVVRRRANSVWRYKWISRSASYVSRRIMRDAAKRWRGEHGANGVFRKAGDDEAEWNVGMGSHVVYKAEDVSLLPFFNALVESIDHYHSASLRRLGLEALRHRKRVSKPEADLHWREASRGPKMRAFICASKEFAMRLVQFFGT